MINAADLIKAHEAFFQDTAPKEQDASDSVVTLRDPAPYPLQGAAVMYPLKGKL